MANSFQAVRGFNDILPQQAAAWQKLEATLKQIVNLYAYQEVKLPIVEQTSLFKRTIGAVTDIIEKEMYTFTDLNGDSLSLRPEGTAGCVRAAIENGMLRQVQKLWYQGPMFRHEKPQKGRYRQFHQFGVELFGLPEIAAELELLVMTQRMWERLGLADSVNLEVNTLGSSEERQIFKADLQLYFQQKSAALTDEEKQRLQKNPLRLLDSKAEHMQILIQEAPKLIDYISTSSLDHFNLLCSGINSLGINFKLNPCLVRGLDYYHDLVFEWTTPLLGSQATVCAGGRYNGLVAQLGGPQVPAVGFAIGLERILLLQEQQANNCPDIFIVTQEQQPLVKSFQIAELIREQTAWSVEMCLAAGSFKSQFKKADKSGAKIAIILGNDELQANKVCVKLLRQENHEQYLLNCAELINWLHNHGKEL